MLQGRESLLINVLEEIVGHVEHPDVDAVVEDGVGEVPQPVAG